MSSQNNEFFKDLFSLNLSAKCDWLPANQFLFQLANVFLVFTYFVKPNGLGGLIQLRISLTLAGLCFGTWGGMVICSIDCLLWNLAFAVGNAGHLVYLLARLKHKPFTDDHELIYTEIFQPVGVKRFQYHELARISTAVHLKAGEYYARQNITESNHVGIIASGGFEVLLEGTFINHINKYEFVDSPEWISMCEETQTTYQVSLVAKRDSKVYQWQRKDLIKLFKKNTILKNVFDLLIGKDICKKLYSLHQTFLMQENTKAFEQLKQASLLTYSAANLFDENRALSPYLSPLLLLRNKKEINMNSQRQQQQPPQQQTIEKKVPATSATQLHDIIDINRSQKSLCGIDNQILQDDTGLSTSLDLSSEKMYDSSKSSLAFYNEDHFDVIYNKLADEQNLLRETDL